METKPIDHFRVKVSIDGNPEVKDFQSRTQPKVENGFLVIFMDDGNLHINLSKIDTWAFQIIEKE